jgi:hypothetical protein
MTVRTVLVCSALLPTLAASLVAQGEDAPTRNTARPHISPASALSVFATGVATPGATPLQPAPTGADLMAPVHTNADDPVGGPYGIWAAGPNYKASFHDGFAFYPVLGTEYPHNLPLGWHTETITAGGKPIVTALEGAPTWTDWRVELRHGPVTEAYDVLRNGVEQTFVLHRAPTQPGDVVVKGRITTELEARNVAAAHQSLSFFDQRGTEIARYGAAFAFDAAGRRTTVTTSFDGSHVELTLAGSFLVGATYPVTIDPLTSSVIIATWGGTANGQPSFPDVVRNDDTNELYVSYSRASAASDYDTFVRATADDFSGTVQRYTDVTASWSTRYNQVAFVSASDRFVVALGREFPGSSQAQVRAYVHDVANTTLNSGTTLFLIPPAGEQDQQPSIGGTWGFAAGTNAYMAFRRDVGAGSPNTDNSEVWGVVVNCGTVTPAVAPSLGTPANLETVTTNYDAEWPCVTQFSGGGTASWIVVWQEYNNGIAGDDWDIITQRIESDGALAGRSFFGPASATTHKVRPKVAGLGERYAVTYTELDNVAKTGTPWGHTVSAQRFDWSETSAAPVKQPERVVSSVATNTLTTGDGNRGISYDDNTDSHWAVAWHSQAFDVFAARLGFEAGVAERVTVYNTADSGFSPSITYNNDACEFLIVWATNEGAPTSQPVLGARFQYAAATSSTYGVGCAGTISGSNRGCIDPHKGSEFYTIRLTGGRANAPTFLFAGAVSGNTPLPLGSAGCRLLINSAVAFIDAGSGASNAAGNFAVTVPIPSTVGNINVYWQFLQIDALFLWSSDGLRTDVR